jgi:DNA-binding PadR family transcriptional regulator
VLLELTLLGLLHEEDLHGYELRKRAAEALGQGDLSDGSVYPALKRLEAAGAIRVLGAAPRKQVGVHTGSLDGELAAMRAGLVGRVGRGRARRVYSLTPVGRALFGELLSADSGAHDDDRLFQARLTFARYLPIDERLALFNARRVTLADRLARLRNQFRDGLSRLDVYAHELGEHVIDGTERDISWLDSLIERERARRTDDPAEVVGRSSNSPVATRTRVAAPTAKEFLR